MFRSITLPWESSLILERSPGVHLVAYVVLGEVNLSPPQAQLEWKTLESWTVAHWVDLVSRTDVAKQGTGAGMQNPYMNGESMLKLESWKIINFPTHQREIINSPWTSWGFPPGSTGSTGSISLVSSPCALRRPQEFVWEKQEPCAARLKAYVLEKKQTQRAEDLVPGAPAAGGPQTGPPWVPLGSPGMGSG